MATRKKHIRTPYEDERKKHRAAASRHVLALEAQIKEDDKRKLFHIANDLRVYGNHLTNIAQKRVSQLFRTKAYRGASQYDHKSNSYNKKKLSQRWHKFEDGTKVQRDIYSAFLLLCHNDDFKTINQDICILKYETFKKAHDKCISDIKTSGQKVCNSGI